MKKLVIIIILSVASVHLNAQIKILEVQNEADTLLSVTQRGVSPESILNLFKGAKGYLFKVDSSAPFTVKTTLYLGESKDDALKTLRELSNLCDNDIATAVKVEDSIGAVLYIKTAYMAAIDRKTTFVKSDRLYIKKEGIDGYMLLNQKTIEDTIKFLGK